MVLSSAKPSLTAGHEPEPPQTTSKPQPSPSPATAASSASKVSSSPSDDDTHPLAGSEPEAVGIPDSDEESEEAEEIADDARLPPDPRTIKVAKGFYDNIPSIPQPGAQVPPRAPSPTPVTGQVPANSPLFGGKTSTTPAGFPKAPRIFAQPVPSIRESPRSPSPVRSDRAPVQGYQFHDRHTWS